MMAVVTGFWVSFSRFNINLFASAFKHNKRKLREEKSSKPPGDMNPLG